MIGAPLLLTLPSRVIHRLDAWSALMPSFDELQSLIELDRNLSFAKTNSKRRPSIKADRDIFHLGYHFRATAASFLTPCNEWLMLNKAAETVQFVRSVETRSCHLLVWSCIKSSTVPAIIVTR
jgi:hypothetical protein